jgi:hypothetical protein
LRQVNPRHAPLDLAAVLGARHDLLPRVAALLKVDAADRLEVHHLRYELVLRRGADPRPPGADFLEGPALFAFGTRLGQIPADLQETPFAEADRHSAVLPGHARNRHVGVPETVLRPGVALVRHFHLGAQNEHRQALRHGRGEVPGELQQKAFGRRNHQHGGEQAALGGAPAGERRAIGRELGDVVGELRVEKCTRVGSGDRKQSVAI